MEVYAVRLQPEEDVTAFLRAFVIEKNLKAAFILTCVGSVKSVQLRFATDVHGDEKVSEIVHNLEVCSLVGTISQDGCHLHGTFGDVNGCTVSGHILGKMIVQTTLEVVIGNIHGSQFLREFDSKTGFKELVVMKN